MGKNNLISSENEKTNVFHTVFQKGQCNGKDVIIIPNEPPSAHFSPQWSDMTRGEGRSRFRFKEGRSERKEGEGGGG